jgi:hypothetical protein
MTGLWINVPTREKQRYRVRGLVYRSIAWAVIQRANEIEADLQRQEPFLEEEWLGSDKTCQGHRSRATQRDAQYPKVVTRQFFNVLTRSMQSYPERGSLSRSYDSAVIQSSKESQTELLREGLSIENKWLGSDSTCQRKQRRGTQRGASVSRRSDLVVSEYTNDNGEDRHWEGLGMQKEWLGSEPTSQRERKRAKQRGVHYSGGVTQQWPTWQWERSRGTHRGAQFPEDVTRQWFNLLKRTKQSYTERCPLSRTCESAVTQRANDSEAELHREGFRIQMLWLGNISTYQRDRNRVTQRGPRYPEGVTQQWLNMPTRANQS